MALTASEQLAHSTVRIESITSKGKVATGTGFFFRCVDEGEQHVPVIVTNRHVIEDGTNGRFYLTLSDAAGEPIRGSHIQIKLNFEKRWFLHPNASIDLAVLPVAPLLTQANKAGKQFFYVALDKNLLPTAEELVEFTALEDILMIGYPNGIWDRVNNLPIFRRGITATHPNVDYNGRPEFMIDAACFPGSSGSPVFLYNTERINRDGTIRLGTWIKLLGVLYAGPQHTAEGEIRIVTVPTTRKAVAVSAIPNNLGVVIKSRHLLEFDDILRKHI